MRIATHLIRSPLCSFVFILFDVMEGQNVCSLTVPAKVVFKFHARSTSVLDDVRLASKKKWSVKFFCRCKCLTQFQMLLTLNLIFKFPLIFIIIAGLQLGCMPSNTTCWCSLFDTVLHNFISSVSFSKCLTLSVLRRRGTVLSVLNCSVCFKYVHCR